jgi:N-acetylneuraminic acid mutarotase
MNETTTDKQTTPTTLSRRLMEAVMVFGCCSCFIFPPAMAAPGSWTRKADLPKALDLQASCEIDGVLYVVGGHEIPGVYRQLATLYAYDPKTDAWTRKKDMPTARRTPAAVAVDGILYVIGGGGWLDPSSRAMEAYDPRTDTWVTKAPMPTDRFALCACAVNGIIYAIAGARGMSGNIQFLATVEAYNPATDQWSRKASLPKPAWEAVANAVDGLIYVFFRKETFAYDPQADRWAPKARIPAGSLNSYFSTSSVVDGIIYLFGGASDDSWTTHNLTVAYDPARDSFRGKRNLPMPCEAAASATIGGKIYHSGGASADPTLHPDAVYYDSLWVFDPQGGVAPELLSVTRESPTSVRLSWQGEPGRLYGVKSAPDVVRGPWTRLSFPTGTNSILATNEVVEAICPVPSADPARFFEILEAN